MIIHEHDHELNLPGKAAQLHDNRAARASLPAQISRHKSGDLDDAESRSCEHVVHLVSASGPLESGKAATLLRRCACIACILMKMASRHRASTASTPTSGYGIHSILEDPARCMGCASRRRLNPPFDTNVATHAGWHLAAGAPARRHPMTAPGLAGG